jgi:membrane fusion protein
MDHIVLTAPVAGEVGDISGEPGQRARPDTSLVTIVPAGSRLQVWLYAPTRAIGFVRPGQEVRLMFDAFPHQRHGAGRGRVVEISEAPVEPSAIDPGLGIEEPAFRVRVEIEELPRRGPRGPHALRPGMTLSGNLVLERRGLWELFFNPIFTALRG